MTTDVYAPDPTAASTTYFKPLFTLPSGGSHSIDISGLIPVVFLVVFLIWVAYSLAAAYHWLRYGHQSWLAIPALALHLFVSGTILIYMLTGLQ